MLIASPLKSCWYLLYVSAADQRRLGDGGAAIGTGGERVPCPAGALCTSAAACGHLPSSAQFRTGESLVGCQRCHGFAGFFNVGKSDFDIVICQIFLVAERLLNFRKRLL